MVNDKERNNTQENYGAYQHYRSEKFKSIFVGLNARVGRTEENADWKRGCHYGRRYL
jgi:hypothetical protein